MKVIERFKYKAFISYSHAADGKIAPALQQALHQFAKSWKRRRTWALKDHRWDMS